MTFNSSQYPGLSFVTPNHNSHDEAWLLPGVTSSFFCFACAVEGLEDQLTLNIRKKKIAGELLKVFIVNENIGKMICSKQNIYLHLLNLFVSIISKSLDHELNDVVSQCCLLLVKRTNSQHAAPVVLEDILAIKGFAQNHHFVSLLCSLLDTAPSIGPDFYKKQGFFIEEIIKATSGCSNSNLVTLWKLLSLILESGVKSSNHEISKDIGRLVLTSALETVNISSIVGVELHILNCLRCFAESKVCRIILIEHECSKLTSSSQSVVEVVKKMLLSSNRDFEICAIRFVSSICDPQFEVDSESSQLLSLVSIVLEKGLGEFIFELLATAGEVVVSELFQCLHKLIYSKSFCKMGHMVYGVSTAVKAMEKVENSLNLEPFYQGIVLLEAMLVKGIFSDHRNYSVKDNCKILMILERGFTKPLVKLKYMLVSCFCVYLSQIQVWLIEDFKVSFQLLEVIFMYLEEEFNVGNSNIERNKLQFIYDSYKAVYLLSQNISKESIKSEKLTCDDINTSQLSECLDIDVINNIIDNLYYLCDKYVTPQAVLKFLPLKNVRLLSMYYQTLLAIIELSAEKGKKLAFKLAESSFFRLIFDFKATSIQTISQGVNDILAKLLLYLCLSVETDIVDSLLRDPLLDWFIKFSIPFNEWKFLLVPSPLVDQMSAEFLDEARTCVFAMLAYSHKAGQPLLAIHLAKSHLENFAKNQNSIMSLPIIGKRYFFYLWCLVEILQHELAESIAGSKHVLRMLEAETENMKTIFMNSDSVIIWILKNDVTLKWRTSMFEMFFHNVCNQNKDGCLEKLMTKLNSHNIMSKFTETLFSSVAACTNKVVIDEFLSAFLVSLNYVGAADITYFKMCIHKNMINSNSLEHFQICALYKCYCNLQIALATEINDNDLKLLCKSLCLLCENSTPTLRLELLNFVNVLLGKSVQAFDAKPTSILLGKAELMLDFETAVFTNSNFIQNSISSNLLEKTNAVIIMIVTELLSGVQLVAACNNDMMKVRMDLFIETFTSTSVPLIQVASLFLWKKLFELKLYSPLLKFIDETMNDFVLTNQHVRLIYIRLQNLCCNSEDLIRASAVDCLSALVNTVNKPDLIIKQPWTKVLINEAVRKLCCDGSDLPSLRLLCIYSKHPSMCDKFIFELAISMVKQCVDETVNDKVLFEVINLMEIVVQQYIEYTEYSDLKELKKLLKLLLGKFIKDRNGFPDEKILFESINGLLVAKAVDIDPMLVLERIRKTKTTVCERIISIDDETDSGEDGV